MIERLKRIFFCDLLPLHYGYTDVDEEAGLMYFQCTRCGRQVGHQDRFYAFESLRRDS